MSLNDEPHVTIVRLVLQGAIDAGLLDGYSASEKPNEATLDAVMTHMRVNMMPLSMDPTPGFRGVGEPPPGVGGELLHRAMERTKAALAEEFKDEPEWPQLTMVCSAPPDGKVAVGTTEATLEYALESLIAGTGTIQRMLRLDAQNN